jgi:hypothetical protein
MRSSTPFTDSGIRPSPSSSEVDTHSLTFPSEAKSETGACFQEQASNVEINRSTQHASTDDGPGSAAEELALLRGTRISPTVVARQYPVTFQEGMLGHRSRGPAYSLGDVTFLHDCDDSLADLESLTSEIDQLLQHDIE